MVGDDGSNDDGGDDGGDDDSGDDDGGQMVVMMMVVGDDGSNDGGGDDDGVVVEMVTQFDSLTFHMHNNLLLNAFHIQSILGRTNKRTTVLEINSFNQQ